MATRKWSPQPGSCCERLEVPIRTAQLVACAEDYLLSPEKVCAQFESEKERSEAEQAGDGLCDAIQEEKQRAAQEARTADSTAATTFKRLLGARRVFEIISNAHTKSGTPYMCLRPAEAFAPRASLSEFPAAFRPRTRLDLETVCNVLNINKA